MLIITKFKASRRHHFISTRHSIFISREVLTKTRTNNNTNKKQRSTETTNESQPATGGSRYPPPGAPSGDKALYNKINFRLRAAAMPEVVQGQTCFLSFCYFYMLLWFYLCFVISTYALQINTIKPPRVIYIDSSHFLTKNNKVYKTWFEIFAPLPGAP